jgi:hypothetical protein
MEATCLQPECSEWTPLSLSEWNTAVTAKRTLAKRAPGAARARGSVRRTRAAAPAPAAVQLITPAGTIDIDWPKPQSKAVANVQRLAMEWTHVVRNRGRWAGTPSLAAQQDAKARELLKELGITDAQRAQLAGAGAVQVTVSYEREEKGWEARILPWEFVLSAGTRDLRTVPLVVTRLLRRARKSPPAAYGKVLFVESAPGGLAQDWDFEDERKLVEHYTGAATFERLVSPDAPTLRTAVAKLEPDIVHLAGFDSHQGLYLLKDPRADRVFDGYLMAAGETAAPVAAADLAALLVSETFAPSLVFCNIWNSAARIAPALVAAGASSAIGFQDGIDDALAEIFLGNFYRALTAVGDVDQAFRDAWQPLQAQPKPLRGTGIVLWRYGSLREQAAVTSTRTTVPRERPTQVFSPSAVEPAQARDFFAITVKPEPQFSYGLLHNDRDLFQQFLVRNLSNGRIVGLQVFVELHSNEGTYPYRQTFTIDGPVLDLQPMVRIALTSNLARTLDEVLRTSLYVEVSWGSHQLFRETFPVTMAPVDQWADTDADRIFLPSFVFPRDRAVATVIRNAEHFVTALRDDPTAGFDGYQAIDQELANPFENVDRQVQALWYSVVYKVPASYINPPPTYAVASQRIRTPSEIVGGGFGTCIDLALMLASSLEAVEIYPVVFLLNDHAFPGYWRADTAREAFCTRVASSASNPGTVSNAIHGDGASARRRPGAPWCYDKAALPEIKRAIKRNQLVPLESVGLTGRSSFHDAAVEARGYFEPEEESRFLMMLDVKMARDRGVTPLPLGPRLQ